MFLYSAVHGIKIFMVSGWSITSIELIGVANCNYPLRQCKLLHFQQHILMFLYQGEKRFLRNYLLWSSFLCVSDISSSIYCSLSMFQIVRPIPGEHLESLQIQCLNFCDLPPEPCGKNYFSEELAWNENRSSNIYARYWQCVFVCPQTSWIKQGKAIQDQFTCMYQVITKVLKC